MDHLVGPHDLVRKGVAVDVDPRALYIGVGVEVGIVLVNGHEPDGFAVGLAGAHLDVEAHAPAQGRLEVDLAGLHDFSGRVRPARPPERGPVADIAPVEEQPVVRRR